MWSQILLCLLVGIAYASNNPGWKDNSEYVYQVYGRTLASLNQISDDYSGIVLKAKLIVRTRPDGNLVAKISEPQYAPIHAPLQDGWDQEIPDSTLSFEELPISVEPFEIVMNEGAVRGLIVDQEISTWEANVIKSFVSQLQLDTNAKNLISSHINILAQEGSNTAVYKTMEETVTGVSETLYEIHPLPEYLLQTTPWLAPLKNLRGDGDIIEVVKNKNFTHSTHRPAYHFGLEGIDGYEFANKIGDSYSRNSVSRAVISGDLNRFTIQSSVTVDQILLSPTMGSKQQGSVNTIVNITLSSVLEQSQEWQQPSNPINIGLVYQYGQPFTTSNKVRTDNEYDHKDSDSSAESYNPRFRRVKRTIEDNLLRKFGPYYADSSSEEEESWYQPRPKLTEAPESPLLPFTVGYDGQSFKLKQNIVETIRKLAQKIAQEIQRLEEIPIQNTVGKFLVLTSLVRVMDANEMQQVAEQLYSNEKHSSQKAAWQVYRDAVAQSGTGPALLTIKDWIKTNKINNRTAAEVIGTAAYAARQPTEEYMKAFFAMVQNEDVMSHSYLNESALLSFTNLVYEVYVNKEVSHKKYPVHSFGHFRTSKGLEFVRDAVIPYLNQKLQEAVSADDTELIHAYIRALGNVGHQRILEAFEPYLEGKKQVSHFQRVLMVLALDKLVKSHPRVARSVLYKIYQNPSEHEQVRVAAVGQLMRTSPSPSMLQRMASYTNYDPNDYVNSVVKSAIETASQLEGNEQAKLRSAAQSAVHLLTSEEYGEQYSYQKFRSYVVDHMRLSYKQSVISFGSPDYILPKGIKYNLRSNFGGIQQQLVNVQAMISSVDDLIYVFHQQTEEYEKQQQQKRSHNASQNQWSSESIAQLLNLDYEQREQLEGNVYFQMGRFQNMWSFDNQTIEDLPRVIKELEQQLRNGQEYDYTKMYVGHETAVSFPTALGLPFIYTYDRPTFVRFEASIKVNANPSLSSGEHFCEPNTVESEFEIRAFVAGRTQSQFGFITPFDNQRYSAGYDKNFQVLVPLAGTIHLDLQKKQLKAEFKNANSGQNSNLLHYSSWPYTAKNDIYSPAPEHRIIRKQYPYIVNRVLGEKSTGIALNWKITSDERIDVPSIYQRLRQHDLVSAILCPWIDENIQYVEANVVVDSPKSFTQKVVVQLGYQQEYQSSTPSSKIGTEQEFPEDSLKRQKEFIKRAGAGINNANVYVADATFLFQGQKQLKYTATMAGSKSNVDPKGRVLVLFKKAEKQSQPSLRFYMSADTYVPNTNGLNFNYAMQMDTTSKVDIAVVLSGSEQKPSKINTRVEFTKSEERKEYLREQPEYQECLRQMQEGNYQLPVCAKMTAQANLLDRFVIKTVYDDIDPRIVNYTYMFYSALRHQLYPKFEENLVDVQPESKGLDIEGQFHPDLRAVNFSIVSPYGRVEARNVKINEWASDLLVPHPVFHIGSRLHAHAYKYDTYRPICIVDKTAASTFDNRTYPLSLEDDWSVLLQYVPRRPLSSEARLLPMYTVPEQLEQHVESYVVLVRASEQDPSQKELKMVLQTPGTEGKIIEILLKPKGSSQFPRLFLNNEEIKYSQQYAYDIYGEYIQVYALPNKEVKLEVFGAYYVIYDGERIKFTAVNSKFRDATRGLCGTFTGEAETDFIAPSNCILQDPEDFVASYTISPSGNKMTTPADQEECYQKKVVFANYISAKDSGHYDSIDIMRSPASAVNSCTKHQTQYVVQGGETCFTLHPLPTCKKGCRQGPTVPKNVPVHCVRSTAAVQLWKNEINKGASPDFSLKSQSRVIRMPVPQRCLP